MSKTILIINLILTFLVLGLKLDYNIKKTVSMRNSFRQGQLMISNDIPLIDLHRHIEGNMRIRTILELAQQHNLDLPAQDEANLRTYVQVQSQQPGVMVFLDKFSLPMRMLVNLDACRRVAFEAVLDAAAEGIDYIELRFSPWFMAETHALATEGVVEAVLDGIRAGQEESGLKVKLLGILSRTYGPEIAMQELEAMLPYAERIVGLDLAGDEANYPAELFQRHFDKAREVGWKVTVHAGEAAGAESVWQSIKLLGAQRIGHGLAIMNDPALIDFLLERQIGIEANLTSNVQTSSVADYASHPLKRFLELGLCASINTDDPGISGIDLPYEFEVAAPQAGLTPALIRQAQLNALESAFLTPQEKQALVKKKA
jgi:adenosine deaminase